MPWRDSHPSAAWLTSFPLCSRDTSIQIVISGYPAENACITFDAGVKHSYKPPNRALDACQPLALNSNHRCLQFPGGSVEAYVTLQSME